MRNIIINTFLFKVFILSMLFLFSGIYSCNGVTISKNVNKHRVDTTIPLEKSKIDDYVILNFASELYGLFTLGVVFRALFLGLSTPLPLLYILGIGAFLLLLYLLKILIIHREKKDKKRIFMFFLTFSTILVGILTYFRLK